jgi:rhamnulokinase
MSGKNFIAIDLGAESGRAIVGTVKNKELSLHEIHRFPNKLITIDKHIHWDLPYLLNEIKLALTKTSQARIEVDGIGIDTWGVDFGLLDSQGELIQNPFAYRDSRTDGMMEKTFEIISRKTLYKRTGIQFMQFNSLYQLYSMLGSTALGVADKLLFMPDLLNYYLCGEKVSEYTVASTSQLLNAKHKKWDSGLFDTLGLPSHIMPPLVKPGTVIGSLTHDVQKATGMSEIDVIAVGAHDTASAVAAVPIEGDNCAYLSSGTWSLVGIESPIPIINEKSYKYSFTNEGGVNNDYRFLKNTMGLWLLQQSREAWQQQGLSYEYEELIRMAEQAEPFWAVINPDDVSFLNPPHMPKAIIAFCQKTNQNIPQNPAQITRVIMESLALKYRFIVEKMNEISQTPVEKMHIVGGGSRNHMLNQFTANALGIPVIAGPVEATAIGNILVQLLAKNVIERLDEGRHIVRKSFEQKTFFPQKTEEWTDIYHRVNKWFV